MKRVGDKISYVRYPIARNSIFSLSLAAGGLALAALCLWLSVSMAGQAGMLAGSLGFTSIVAELVSLWFTLMAFYEDGKNYILAKISGVLAGLVLICWIMVIIVGFR